MYVMINKPTSYKREEYTLGGANIAPGAGGVLI